MKSFNNEIVIRQGQSLTIDKFIENIDGSPYIISSKLQNPYFLITVASSTYKQANSYIKNYWLDLKNFPRFLKTRPVDLKSIKIGPTDSTAKYNNFPAELPNGYINGLFVEFEHGDAVFSLTVDGVTQYKYYDLNGRLLNYRCRLVKLFASTDTQNLVAQNYLYSIKLVAGPLAEEGQRPISKFDVSVDILKPTSFIVLSNLDGGENE